jgi:hypothetical protein
MRFAKSWPALAAVAGLGWAGCATTQTPPVTTLPMAASSAAPTARGEVAVSPLGPNNQLVVSIVGLAPPAVVDPVSRLYVAWVEPLDRSAEPQNVGAFAIGDDGIGRLVTTTPMRRFQLFVTPEPSATVRSPSGRQLLTVDIAPRPGTDVD